MNRVSTFLGCNALAVMLAACGGGGGADPATAEDPPARNGVPYPFSASGANGETETAIRGVAVRSDATNETIEITFPTGTKNNVTRATEVSDGDYLLVDGNGFDDAGRLTDGQSTLSLRPAASNYTSLRTFEQIYTVNGVSYDSVGVLGVATRPEDLPTEGSATYRGTSDLIIIAQGQGFSVAADSKVVASFSGSGSVNVTIDRFVTTDLMTGDASTAPIDEIRVTGMSISDGGFSGGTIQTLQRDEAIDIIGADPSAVSEGVFFGYDATLSQPDEVGGMILMTGRDGTVLGSFIAD